MLLCLSPNGLLAHEFCPCASPYSLTLLLLLPCPAAYCCQSGFSPKSTSYGLSTNHGYCTGPAVEMDPWWDGLPVMERKTTLKWLKLMGACGRGMDAQRAWGLARTPAGSS